MEGVDGLRLEYPLQRRLAVELGWRLGGHWARPWLRHGGRVAVVGLLVGPFAAIRASELRYLGSGSDFSDLLRFPDRWSDGIAGCRFGGLPGALLVGSLVFLASVLLERRRQKAWPSPCWKRAVLIVAAVLRLWLNWYDPVRWTAPEDTRGHSS